VQRAVARLRWLQGGSGVEQQLCHSDGSCHRGHTERRAACAVLGIDRCTHRQQRLDNDRVVLPRCHVQSGLPGPRGVVANVHAKRRARPWPARRLKLVRRAPTRGGASDASIQIRAAAALELQEAVGATAVSHGQHDVHALVGGSAGPRLHLAPRALTGPPDTAAAGHQGNAAWAARGRAGPAHHEKFKVRAGRRPPLVLYYSYTLVSSSLAQ
jgi:hypothetical protein